MEYLLSKDTNCQTFILNLTHVCNNDSTLSFKHYYDEMGVFKVAQSIYSAAQKIEVTMSYCIIY